MKLKENIGLFLFAIGGLILLGLFAYILVIMIKDCFDRGDWILFTVILGGLSFIVGVILIGNKTEYKE